MTKKEVTKLSFEITGLAIKVHKKLGPGLLESVYEQCLKFELERNGYDVKQQLNVKIEYDDLELDSTLKIDLLVNDTVIVELKTVEKLAPIHESQLLTYMKLLEKPQGLLINFYTTNITKSMKPFVNEYFSRLDD
ncbi:MAG: GxxExxY protein [Flavobacterium sp.]|jgi:GxxExxY protein|uniref:GxxExxY protein n=1 Tax=Flavobacterium macrobrachii TaxID=591204 RepID=A0ABS2D107_9FLAO|nr:MULTISPECIES: GxxExxY protein [Flavobacterium]MBM6500897.1 GxxExxY protein [Flavobacterium macrobrachii]MCZ8089740.1 GxxExxY protein [Flavobacterium sp.]MCZ8329725.1 GxxExxY protein [Flavobacterium sp.]PZO29315.1 MAG: GxxExxY protein [Flavobacteriaceae bacterium]